MAASAAAVKRVVTQTFQQCYPLGLRYEARDRLGARERARSGQMARNRFRVAPLDPSLRHPLPQSYPHHYPQPRVATH